MNEGDLLVDSELVLPARPDLGVGERTRKITTVHTGSRATTREQTVGQCAVVVRDRRRRTHRVRRRLRAPLAARSSRTPSRSGAAVSPIPWTFGSPRRPTCRASTRAFAGIAATGRFFLIDLSSLGTTLNGRHVPRGYDEVDGTKRENGVETALPDTARIGLADTVFLEFRKVR